MLVTICSRLSYDLVAIDGAFFHGDASKESIVTRKRLAEQLVALERDIEAYGCRSGGQRRGRGDQAADLLNLSRIPTGKRRPGRTAFCRYRPHRRAYAAILGAGNWDNQTLDIPNLMI